MPTPRHPARTRALAIALGVLVLTSGCATLRTLDTLDEGKPALFSGTRLNTESLVDRTRAERRAGVAAPRFAAIDLPFSIALDTFLLPITTTVAMTNGVSTLLRRIGRP